MRALEELLDTGIVLSEKSLQTFLMSPHGAPPIGSMNAPGWALRAKPHLRDRQHLEFS